MQKIINIFFFTALLFFQISCNQKDCSQKEKIKDFRFFTDIHQLDSLIKNTKKNHINLITDILDSNLNRNLDSNLRKLSIAFKDSILFSVANYDQKNRLKIKAIPLLTFYKKGQKVKSYIGDLNYSELVYLINDIYDLKPAKKITKPTIKKRSS